MAEDSQERRARDKRLAMLDRLHEEGAEVFGLDGDKVGDLKSFREDHIVVARGVLRGDLRVPLAAVRDVTDDNKIVLDIASEHVDDMGWGEEG